MAKYITPSLTITSNAYDATSNPGPTTSPLNVSVSDLLDVTEVRSSVIDSSTTHEVLFDADTIAATATASTDGGFIFLRNLTEGLTTTADIYIGHGSSAALHEGGGSESTRLMTLKPGEFSFFAWDMEADIILDASAAVVGALEAVLFVRTGTA
jgi:hypothetical protein